MSSPAKPKAKGGMTWNDTAQAHLLQCILNRHAPAKVDYQGLEKDMRALGYDCTAKALTHRVQKLRAVPSTGVSGNESDATTPTATPAKAPATTKKPRASPTKKAPADGKGKGKAAAAKGKAGKRKAEEMEKQEGSGSEHEDKKMKKEEDEEEGEDEEDGEEEPVKNEV
ncbi:MAG: hypothetical protein Q9215_005872 [Flavoplaca cf. flavocitrina]